VLHEQERVVNRAQQVAAEWLASVGLELKPSKTRVAHTLWESGGQIGFDFLGFHVRQHTVGKTHSGKNTNGVLLGFKTIITPSTTAVRRHAQALRNVVQRDKGGNQASLITHLNPVIRGWARYYATVVAGKTFGTLDYLLYQKLRSWARYQHPHKSRRWVATKYWHPDEGNWTFAVKNGPRLYLHSQTTIQRHVKVMGTKSPFDGDWRYWTRRLQRHPLVRTRVANLLKRDHGRCNWCGLSFRDGDQLEVDHIVPKWQGGRDTLANLQVLHQHCHDAKSANDTVRPK
jgi:RNA-directed DNA polymerase